MRNKIQLILDYLRDKLSNSERHAFEKELNSNPFLNDAMEGFSKLTPDELEDDLKLLSKKIEQGTKAGKKRNMLPFLRVAATLITAIGIGTIILLTKHDDLPIKEVAEQTPPPAPEKSAKSIPEAEPLDDSGLGLEKAKQQQQRSRAETEEQRRIRSQQALADKKEAENESNIFHLQVEEEEAKEILAEEDIIMEAEEEVMASAADFEAEPTVMALKAVSVTDSVIEVKGKVIDSDNFTGLPGVTIISAENATATITDTAGNFTLMAKTNDNITIQTPGYEDQNISVEQILANSQPIAMSESTGQLEETVVVGYGTAKKKEALRSMKGDEAEPALLTHAKPVDGYDNFHNYIKKNKKIDYNENYTVEVQLTVKADGSIGNIEFITDENESIRKEITRLITKGPKWKPAIENGNAIEQIVKLEIQL